jgi:hypothetical protein
MLFREIQYVRKVQNFLFFKVGTYPTLSALKDLKQCIKAISFLVV